MDVSDILDPLNDPQREAVTAEAKPMLILAGAGSGKTRVLAHRVAWMMRVENLSPYAILSVTFTNKAAAEMRGRIEQLVGHSVGGMWVGTFHGIAHRLLRAHWQDAGLPQGFQILDSDDQYRLIRRVIRGMELDESRFPPKQVQWTINGHKDEGLRPKHLEDNGDPIERTMIAIYTAYEEACRIGGMVDFAELLLRALELWRDRADILQHYRKRFRTILVDEFQDTNAIQYAWIRMLSGDQGNVFVVGDDDQSIYGWRGAQIENIQRFRDQFKDCSLVRLEQNYRSTATILKAANALIDNNDDRLGKNLWTDGDEGEAIQVYEAYNELEEARYVVDSIAGLVADGWARADCAILYRSNALSRLFEEALITANIPYKVYGGMRFFERAEIKDALSYLRLVNNRNDDTAFERAVNTPPRGIGLRTVDAIRSRGREQGVSLFRACRDLAEASLPNSRAANALKTFIEIIENLAEETREYDLGVQTETVVERSGLIPYFKKEKGEKGRARVENLEELVSAATAFTMGDEDEEMEPLSAFLAHAVLEAGETQGAEWDDCVQLMTLHSAKGLEFKQVFLCGMEEGTFPHEYSIQEPGRLSEERRLCYVGITRARERLTISHAERRRLHGRDNYCRPSRFVGEIPAELVLEVRPRVSVSQPVYGGAPRYSNHGGKQISGTELSLGQRVLHGKFGEGVVTNYEGSGAHARVQVHFDSEGAKWLVIGYANLQAV